MDRNPVSLPAGFNPKTWKLKVEMAGKLVMVAEPVSQAEELAARKTSKAAIEMARLRETGLFMILLFDRSVFLLQATCHTHGRAKALPSFRRYRVVYRHKKCASFREFLKIEGPVVRQIVFRDGAVDQEQDKTVLKIGTIS
jgi:hypothetical protein